MTTTSPTCRTGVSSQQTDASRTTMAGDNLDAPLAGDHQAHGQFDDRAHAHSPQLALALHRGPVLAAAVAGAAALLRLRSR